MINDQIAKINLIGRRTRRRSKFDRPDCGFHRLAFCSTPTEDSWICLQYLIQGNLRTQGLKAAATCTDSLQTSAFEMSGTVSEETAARVVIGAMLDLGVNSGWAQALVVGNSKPTSSNPLIGVPHRYRSQPVGC